MEKSSFIKVTFDLSHSNRFTTTINEQNLEPRQNVDKRWIFTLNVHTSIHLHPGLQEVQGSYQCWNSLPLCFVEYTGGGEGEIKLDLVVVTVRQYI